MRLRTSLVRPTGRRKHCVSCVAGRQVEYGTEANALDKSADGATKAYVQHYPGDTYISSVFHHVKLDGLAASTTYYYRRAPRSAAEVPAAGVARRSMRPRHPMMLVTAGGFVMTCSMCPPRCLCHIWLCRICCSATHGCVLHVSCSALRTLVCVVLSLRLRCTLARPGHAEPIAVTLYRDVFACVCPEAHAEGEV